MKGNLKKLLASFFVLAMVAAPLYGCNKDKGSSTASTSTAQGVIENDEILVELGRTIYLVNEPLDIVSVQKWSNLGYFVPAGNYRIENTDWNQTPGKKNVVIAIGQDRKTVAVEVYATNADAAAAHSIYVEGGDNSAYFNESEVIDVARKKLKKETIMGEDVNGDPILRSFVGSKPALALNKASGTNSDVWTADESNPNRSVLDSTRYSTPHTRSNKIDNPANPDASDAKYMYAGYNGTRWKAELIFDAEGKLVYFATCIPDNTWQYSGHIHTRKWYSHPDYEDDTTNPGLVIEKDAEEVQKWKDEGWETVKVEETDATEAYPVGEYIYEKVIPEGGFYVFMPNDVAEDIWQWLSGSDINIVGSEGDINHTLVFTQDNRTKTTLNEGRGFFDESDFKMKFYAPSTPKQQYAYYYLEVLNGSETDAAKYAEALAFKDEVYQLIVESANPLIETEPVLADYYDGVVEEKLDQWADMIAAIE